jgi:hypothetical protein
LKASNAERLATWLLVAMPLLALVPRCYLIMHSLYADDADVVDLGFGFGEYVRNLLQSGQFRSCTPLPFIPCDPGICTGATRMPGIPLLLAALAEFVGRGTESVAIAKCFLLAAVVTMLLVMATRRLRVPMFGVLLLYGLYFGPQALKHGASISYEEGVILDLSLCLAIATAYLIRNDLGASSGQRSVMAVTAVAIAASMYVIKTTALLSLVVVLLMVLTLPRISGYSKVLGLALVAVPLVLWAGHNLAFSGRASLSSSWNGENLFRGYNSESVALFPQISLDREFDSTVAVLGDGTVVPLGNYTNKRCFKNEWDWNDFYAKEARQWALDHPLLALRFDLTKAWIALLGVQHTPTYVSATSKTPDYPPGAGSLMVAWMVYARILFFILCLRILWGLRSAAGRAPLWALLLLAATCAPYVLVFSYQRHLIPILVMAGAFLVLLHMARPPVRLHEG